MGNIRAAAVTDVSRIAEIMVFNYRLNFYPFFRNDPFYFAELNVLDMAREFADDLGGVYVYDDGIVKGFIRVEGKLLEKLYVEPQFQSQGVGAELLAYATDVLGADHLWALEYNTRAQAFYKRHGFGFTGEKTVEDEWVPLLKMAIKKER